MSVIVNYSHFNRIAISPSETETPLIVDANTVLACSISLQRFKAVPRNISQVGESGRGIQHFQFSFRRPLNRSVLRTMLVIEKPLRVPRPEASDHQL
jgi:hypothetical protein